MTGAERLGYFLAGLAAATIAAALSGPGHAQSSDPTARSPSAVATPVPPGTAPTPVAPAGPAGPIAPQQPIRFKRPDPKAPAEFESRVAPRVTADTNPDDADGEGLDPEADDDGTDDGQPLRNRPPEPPTGDPVDGDLTVADPQTTPRDGDVQDREPPPLDDGADPTRDTRPEDDYSLFVNPPDDFDPLLFQIEDLDPITSDRRPERLFRFEPYDPVGVRFGSFVFFPEVELAGLATSNVLNSPQAKSDVAGELRERLRLVSNWDAHAVELRGSGLATFHDEYPSENDRDWDIEARSRIDVTRRSNVESLVSRGVSQESRSAIDAARIGPRPNVTVDTAQVAGNQRFNRLSLKLRGTVTGIDYSEVQDAGVTQTNADRDRVTSAAVARASYELKSTFSIFTEIGLDRRRYEVAAQSDGIRRDSEGERYRVGVDFGGTGRIIRGEVSVGYGRQTPNDDRLNTVDAFLFDANLAYRWNELTSFLLTARTDIVDTTTTGSGGTVSYVVGLEARHAFRTHLIGTAGVLYTNNAYDATLLEESELRSYLGLEYYANRDIVLFGRYEHIDFGTTEANAEYDVDEVRLGVRVRR